MYIQKLAAIAAMTMLSVGSTQAAIVAGSDQCGELPNAKWSWQITSDIQTTGGDESTDSSSSTKVAGNNTFLVTTTTTTVSPTYTTTNLNCTALNPQGKVNLDHSTVIMGEPVLTAEGSTSTSSTNLKVCGPNLEPC